MTRIGIDARPMANVRNGIGRFTNELVRRLINNHDFQWYLYSHRPINKMLPKVQLRTPPSCLSNSLLASQVLFPTWAKKDQLDLFWSPRHHLPLNCPCPSVVTVHDLCWKLAPDTMPLLRRLTERLLFPMSVKKAASVTAVSASTLQDLVSCFPQAKEKSCVLGPGLTKHETHRQQSAKSPYILNVGTVEPRKQQRLLVDAFTQVLDKVPHNLVIVGKLGWKTENLDKLIEEKELQDRVRWYPNVNDEELWALYAHADLYVTPSMYEGFNLPILEAMSWGVPIIASDLPVHREVAQDSAVYVQSSVLDLAQAMHTVLTQPELMKRLKLAGEKRCAAYNWQNSADQLINVFQRVLQS